MILQIHVFYSGTYLSFRKLPRQREPKSVTSPIRLRVQRDQRNMRLARQRSPSCGFLSLDSNYIKL